MPNKRKQKKSVSGMEPSTSAATETPSTSAGAPFTVPAGKFLCKICDLNFMNELLLLQHAQVVHSSRPLVDVVETAPEAQETAEEEAMSEEVADQTAEKVETEVYLCSACGEMFLNDRDMTEHCRVAHDAYSEKRIYECSECHDRYETEEAFDEHECGTNRPQIEIIPTVVGEEVTSEEYTLVEVVDEDKSHASCDICSVVFVSQYALNRHNMIVHGARPAKTAPRSKHAPREVDDGFQCGRCDQVFKEIRTLKQHSVGAHGMKWNNVRQRTPQQCSVCGKVFSSMGNLNKHMKRLHQMVEARTVHAVVECLDTTTEQMETEEQVDASQSSDAAAAVTSNIPKRKRRPKQDSDDENDEADTAEEICVEVIEKAETSKAKDKSEKDSVNQAETSEAVQSVQDTQELPVSEEKNDNAGKENATNKEANDLDVVNVVEAKEVVQASGTITVQGDDGEHCVLELNEGQFIPTFYQTGEIHMVIETHPEKSGKATVTVTQSGESSDESPWYCTPCQYVFSSRETLLLHYREHHLTEECEPEVDSPQQCDICLKIFSSKGNRDKHVNSVHKRSKGKVKDKPDDTERITCEHCNKTFKHRTNFSKHLRLNHPEHYQSTKKKMKLNKDATEQDRTCHICGKVFTDLFRKEMHVYNHARSDKLYQCDVCDKTFNRSDYFKEHYEKKHGVPRYQCGICEKRFVRHSYLLVHERVHTNIRPYICKTCGKSFKQWGALYQHQRHHAPKPPATHFCAMCHRGYSYKEDLDRHMVVHGDKKHVCTYCSKAFPSSSQLTVHTRTHTGHRPYKCKQCSMCFMTTGGLRRHQQIHGRRQQGGFMCAICGVSYRRQASVDEHLRVFHGEAAEEQLEVQSVDLIQEVECSVPSNEEVIEFVVQSADTGLQVLTRCENNWVDTTDAEKEIVEGILATQSADKLIVQQTTQES